MCVDEYDDYSSDRIVLGYSSSDAAVGTCVREMVAKAVIGAPVDADTKVLKNTAVERSGKRTVVRFTVSQTWPETESLDGPWRIMWAVGNVAAGAGGAGGCAAEPAYHGINRGVAPLKWLESLGSTPCAYSPTEHMGEL
jgi:hypothetical protein